MKMRKGMSELNTLYFFDLYLQACECDPRGVESGDLSCDFETGQCR